MKTMRILAFDPGYGRTGWGVVETGRSQSELCSPGYGVIETPSGVDIADRLAVLHREATQLIERFQPGAVVMERLFFNRSTTTAAGVFQAQGALLVAISTGKLGVINLGPSEIKLAVTGSGRAGKADVTRMVGLLLGIVDPIRPDDAADALAGAIAGLRHARAREIMPIASQIR